jgi:hypothetical protein
MKKVNFLSRNGEDVTISAVLNFPEAFDERRSIRLWWSRILAAA